VADLKKMIHEEARRHGLNPDVVYALCVVESGLDTWAVRIEPGWRWWLSPLKWAKHVAVTEKTERVCQQMSWGLMQIMGTVARERGMNQDIPALCDPTLGLYYGCKHLKWLLRRYGQLDKALSAYNTGRPNSKTGRAYAERIMETLEELKC